LTHAFLDFSVPPSNKPALCITFNAYRGILHGWLCWTFIARNEVSRRTMHSSPPPSPSTFLSPIILPLQLLGLSPSPPVCLLYIYCGSLSQSKPA
jgi:hypothetical protein